MADETLMNQQAPIVQADQSQVQADPSVLEADTSQQGPTPGTPPEKPDTPDQSQQQPQAQQPQQPQKGPDETVDVSTKNPQQQIGTIDTPSKGNVHPAVKKASLLHDVALALAGGPHFTTAIDPNTGQTTRTQVPISGKQIAMAIALEALGGGIAGMGAHGPNNESQALQAGFQQGAKQAGQAQQAEQQQAADANNDLVRQASVAQTNFQMHQNAVRMTQMGRDQLKQYVDDAAPVLANIQQVGAVKAAGVREGDLLNKYHVTKDMAIVDGVVPRMTVDAEGHGVQAKNPDGSDAFDNTYSVIDPEAQIALPKDTAQFLADNHVPGYFKMVDGKAVPVNMPDNAQIKARMVVDGMASASAIRISEGAINNQLKQLSDPEDQKQFEIKLKDGLDSGTVTPKALKAFAAFSNTPFSQLQASMEKAKIDTATIGQVMSLIPQGAIDASKKQVADQAAKIKADETKANLVVTKGNFDSVLADPKAYSPEQVQAAQAVKKNVANEAANKAYASGRSGEQGRIDAKKANGIPLTGAAKTDGFGISDPDLAQYVKDENYGADGINKPFLDAMAAKNPQRAALVQAILHGQRLESFYGLAKKDGQALAEDVHAADRSFDQSLAQRYNQMAVQFAPGKKNGDKLVAANTALKHLASLVDNTSWTTGLTPDAVGDHSPFHVPGFAARKADMEGLSTELAKYYKGGAPDKDAVAALHQVMSATNPETAKDGARELAKLLHGGIDSVYESWKDSMPSNFVPKQAFFDPAGAAAYQHVTGEAVDPKYLKSQRTPGGGDDGKDHGPQAVVQRQGETPVVHNGQVVGFTMPGKQGMRPVKPHPAQ